MILNQKETTVAYRCPSCGTAVLSLVGAFALTADMLRLKCPCGGSELSAVITKDKKVRLTVPCLVCPKPHTFVLSSQLFFSTESLSFPCAYSGLPVCFAGKSDAVTHAVEEAEAELRELIGERDITALSAQGDPSAVFSDPQIMDIVMYVIHELEAEGEIRCRCESGHGHFTVDILDDHVLIRCSDCGAEKKIPTDSTVSANAFLHCTHIDLT